MPKESEYVTMSTPGGLSFKIDKEDARLLTGKTVHTAGSGIRVGGEQLGRVITLCAYHEDMLQDLIDVRPKIEECFPGMPASLDRGSHDHDLILRMWVHIQLPPGWGVEEAIAMRDNLEVLTMERRNWPDISFDIRFAREDKGVA